MAPLLINQLGPAGFSTATDLILGVRTWVFDAYEPCSRLCIIYLFMVSGDRPGTLLLMDATFSFSEKMISGGTTFYQ
jgi:hypothetical protein